MKSHDDYETFNNVWIETWRKSCLPIFQMLLSAKWSIHERSSASLSSSSSFLVSSLSFCNFSSFLKHWHGRQRNALSWSSSPAEEWHTITLVTVELNTWSNYCVIACSLSAWYLKHSIRIAYIRVTHSWWVNFTGG